MYSFFAPSGSASLHLLRAWNSVWNTGGLCFWPGGCQQRQGELLYEVYGVEKRSSLRSWYVATDPCILLRTFLGWNLPFPASNFSLCIQVLQISCHNDVNNQGMRCWNQKRLVRSLQRSLGWRGCKSSSRQGHSQKTSAGYYFILSYYPYVIHQRNISHYYWLSLLKGFFCSRNCWRFSRLQSVLDFYKRLLQ